MLPSSVNKIRLSVCGDEDVYDLIHRLESLPELSEIHLQLSCRDPSNVCIILESQSSQSSMYRRIFLAPFRIELMICVVFKFFANRFANRKNFSFS